MQGNDEFSLENAAARLGQVDLDALLKDIPQVDLDALQSILQVTDRELKDAAAFLDTELP